MSGRPPLRPDEEVPQLEKAPKVETVPYTEEEYRQLKKKREGMGIFHLDAMPSEKELGTRLRQGMSHAEVLAAFGKPTLGPKEPSDSTYRLFYEVAGEKLPPNPNKDDIPVGFTVDFADGKVTTFTFLEQCPTATESTRTFAPRPKSNFPQSRYFGRKSGLGRLS
jgi:outer membrane protein assembly factor BamE (lipoprotein component of BamABCDE complex)